MALNIKTPAHSFVRFNDPGMAPDCIWGDISFCLPVYNQDDIHFQFIMEGLTEEIDLLCTQDASEIELSLVSDCNTDPLLIFSEKPKRYRLSDTQILYNWNHGLPAFNTVIDIKECFKIQVSITIVYETIEFCSNCLERINDDCFTSVIEYGNSEDSFGFKYCTSGNIDGDSNTECDPTIVQFIDIPTLSIPYTALLSSKYGAMPTVQAWIYDGAGQLVNMGIQVGFDGYPATMINLDFGGNATGIVIIR